MRREKENKRRWDVVENQMIEFCLMGFVIMVFVSMGCSSNETRTDTETGMELSGKNSAFTDVSTGSGQGWMKFSDVDQVTPIAGGNRLYRRQTKQSVEAESSLSDRSGSLWVMEGQSSYLFSQNRVRKEGDFLSVKVEGNGLKQIETKVGVIRKLLKQLEEEEALAMAARSPAGVDGSGSGPLAEGRGIGSSGGSKSEVKGGEDSGGRSGGGEGAKEEPLVLESIPAKIVEKMSDGQYKVRGQSPLMINQQEYKVLISGVIRPEDFNDEGISSNKFIDPKFDVLSVRKKQEPDSNRR